MTPFTSSSAADRRLMPEGRLAGPMPWVLAIMMGLTVLATASGLAISNAAKGLGNELAGRVTIQIAEADAALRKAETSAVISAVSRLSAVETVAAVPEAELKALVAPWLGDQGLELPIPAMIEVSLKRQRPEDMDMVKRVALGAAPDAKVQADATSLAPLARLLTALSWLAVSVVMLMAGASAAAVVLAARAALNTHRSTIEVMHLLGASDVQVAGLFQRRIALDALFGSIVGMVVALAVIALVGARMSALGSELLGSAGLGWQGWLVIAVLPLAGFVLALIAARLTVLSALRRML